MAHAISSLTALATAYLAGGVEAAPWLGLGALVVTELVRKAWSRRRGAAEPREQKLGAYTLDEKIGAGGMGVVYKARHELLRRPAAIKLLAPDRAGKENLARFEREVQVTSMLTHPNTVAIYDFGHTPTGSFYYAMEYLDGLDLQTLVERHGPQDPARVAHLLAQLAGALAEAHGAGLVHRDVKPANVMLCERGGASDVVKVLDFGLTKELAPEVDIERTATNKLVGTPLYLSPEALIDPSSVDARSDLYALGAVGYFLLTGTPPFSGSSILEVCGHHLHSQPEPITARRGERVPAEIEALVMRCLAKNPDERPASAAELQAELFELARGWTQDRARAWWNDGPAKPRNVTPLALAPTACFLDVTPANLAA